MGLFRSRQDDLVVGQTGRFPLVRKYRIPQKARAAHTYVVGITGQGKSKLLEHTLFQDITQGRGCGLLDPHSDLASDTLRYLASWHDRSCMSKPYLADEKNLERIIYFDPSRTDYILPFNVLNTSFGSFNRIAQHGHLQPVVHHNRACAAERLRQTTCCTTR